MTFLSRVIAGLALLVLAACAGGGDQRPDASLQIISSASYRHSGPPALTLFTMINNRSGAGAHTSLMINASQRVIFDPAGTVRLSAVPERGDVLYGIIPEVAEFYARAHARESYHVVIQRVEVSPAVAEQALRLAVSRGGVASAQCAISTAGILRQLPGFEGVSSTWFPKRLMESFGELPGVQTSRIFENDDDDKSLAVAEFEQRVSLQRSLQ
jgi:hypothetical protein